MSISFKQSPTVTQGESVTSKQARCLAEAFNSRLLSGIGDGAQRVAWWWFNAFRQIRNAGGPADVGYPPQAEFFSWPQAVQDADFPQAFADDPGGANTSNVLAQLVFGADGQSGEPNDMMGVPLWINGAAPVTDDDFWELGKLQRGVIDLTTGAQNWPIGTAAQAWLRVQTPALSPHGKSYGGYFPTPEAATPDVCGDMPSNGSTIYNYEIKFTKLADETETVYAGSCPLGTAYTAAGHVVGIARLPFAYYVAVNDGAGGYTVDVYPRNEYIEGPYEGVGRLAHDDGAHVEHALFSFSTEFRGTDSQRTGNFDIRQTAFDFQAFFNRQYQLAPARGVVVGDSIEAQYPMATWTPQTGTGYFILQDGQDFHQTASGFVVSGWHVKATALTSQATVEALDGENPIGTLTLEPGASTGTLWLSTAITPQELRFRLKEPITCEALTVEVAELLDYKPQFWDAYSILRLASSTGGLTDGQGTDNALAKDISRDLFDRGCVTNQNGLPTVASNTNDLSLSPLWQAMRRASQAVKIIPRQQLISYEVAGGKTILRFRRWAIGRYNERADLFAGIAPPWQAVESGKLIEDEIYIVRSAGGQGSVDYAGSTYHPNETFTASEVLQFDLHGDAEIYKRDGLMRTARKQNQSNEWCAFLQTSVYHPSGTSQWTPSTFSDWLAFQNRCLFWAAQGGDTAFKQHVNYDLGNGKVKEDSKYAEAPTGYNYGSGANRIYADDDFKRACQIYQPPYELESVTVDNPGLNEVVVMTFTGRFAFHADAPATVNPDPLTWSDAEKAALLAESYRTDDNACREYMTSEFGGSNCSGKKGDWGATAGPGPGSLADNPFGSCYPRFFFVKLIPKPYEDDNDSVQSHDALCTVDSFQQMEVYLRAMCEGFIDGTTTKELSCGVVNSLFDYRFTNLCFDGFKGNWVGAFSLEARPDNPSGYGPLPNSLMYADVFNRLASCVNLLTRARVMLPYVIECRLATVDEGAFVTPSAVGGAGTNLCQTAVIKAIAFSTKPPQALLPDSPDWGAWGTCATLDLQTQAILEYECGGQGGTQFNLSNNRAWLEFHVKLETNWNLAVPESWRDDVSRLSGFLMLKSRTDTYRRARAVATGAGDGCGGTPSFWDDGTTAYVFDDDITTYPVECVLRESGIVDAGELEASDYPIGRLSAGGVCNEGSLIETQYTPANTLEWFINVPEVVCE